MKRQKLQFALTSLHNLQKNKKTNNDINKKKLSKSDNKNKQKNTNVDI